MQKKPSRLRCAGAVMLALSIAAGAFIPSLSAVAASEAAKPVLVAAASVQQRKQRRPAVENNHIKARRNARIAARISPKTTPTPAVKRTGGVERKSARVIRQEARERNAQRRSA